MKICPKDKTHTEFYAHATIRECWIVDGDGEYISTKQVVEILSPVDADEIWECKECGSIAITIKD